MELFAIVWMARITDHSLLTDENMGSVKWNSMAVDYLMISVNLGRRNPNKTDQKLLINVNQFLVQIQSIIVKPCFKTPPE